MPFALEPTSLRILCNALGDGVILFDGEDRCTFVNDAACRLLATEYEGIRGLSCHNVLMGHLGSKPNMVSRLRAGEVVTCDGPDGLPEAIRAQRVNLVPVDGQVGEAPTAIVLQNLRVGQALRRVEDALMRVHIQDSLVAPRSEDRPGLLAHYDVLRYLAHEVRRSHRDGQELSTMLMSVPLGGSPEHLGNNLARTLRGSDRAGRLQAWDLDECATGQDVTVASLDVALDDRFWWFLAVLPGTATTGAHALVMRLRARLGGEGAVPKLAFGVATLKPLRDLWPGPGAATDCAQSLLTRSLAACVTERLERHAEKTSHAA